ncbi:myotubularin family protein [Cryptosporidium muris RN66]|uniref:Myotubularin family protein n=1 Tax=Cryptosporidium muris (strain RN66) TaxID=441375 RepID=B6ACS4_CRYMR|nr:myotubularin family protein [Cryptosporidium muris RN66]EEA05928.1 myotubularin family protein [Cryptosporidium muris RN66]|eukprot:XP_002140277.1 myotubularin family protein [Cryptosporidium muris RN66]
MDLQKNSETTRSMDPAKLDPILSSVNSKNMNLASSITLQSVEIGHDPLTLSRSKNTENIPSRKHRVFDMEDSINFSRPHIPNQDLVSSSTYSQIETPAVGNFSDKPSSEIHLGALDCLITNKSQGNDFRVSMNNKKNLLDSKVHLNDNSSVDLNTNKSESGMIRSSCKSVSLSSSSVTGLFSSIASTVTQNISTQIQNALRDSTSKSQIMSGKLRDIGIWNKILDSKLLQENSKNISAKPDKEDINFILQQVLLFPGEDIILYSKYCGILPNGISEPLTGSMIISNYRLILIPRFSDNNITSSTLNMDPFLSWLLDSGFLTIPIYVITQFSTTQLSCTKSGFNLTKSQISTLSSTDSNFGTSYGSTVDGINNPNLPFTFHVATKDLRSLQILLVNSDNDRRLLLNTISSTILEPCLKNLFCFKLNNSLKKTCQITQNQNSDIPTSILCHQFTFKIEDEWARLGISEINSKDIIYTNQTSKDHDVYVSNKDDSLLYQNPQLMLRISRVNICYDICPSYPDLLVVPKQITDTQLIKISSFRSKGRIPILSWYCSNLRSSLWRSSQPKSAFKRCIEDELFISTISQFYKNISTNELKLLKTQSSKDFTISKTKFLILDARPKLNAYANKATGAGFENIDYYPNCDLEFLNIENIHRVRDAWVKMTTVVSNIANGVTISNESWNINRASTQKVCYTSDCIGLRLLGEIDSTGWYDLISLILISVNKIVEKLSNGNGVLVHCSDGWDRTSQLTSLSMLCLDPFYRTIEGFFTLIEKEFITVGHKFHSRCGLPGPKHSSEGENERSPIFIQWLDCVYQCWIQNPTEFEFHPNLLLFVAENVHNCLYGNFLCDNEQQRSNFQVRDHTISLWDIILAQIHNSTSKSSYSSDYPFLGVDPNILPHMEFVNPFYRSKDSKISDKASSTIICDVTSINLSPWMAYWLRYTPLSSKVSPIGPLAAVVGLLS